MSKELRMKLPEAARVFSSAWRSIRAMRVKEVPASEVDVQNFYFELSGFMQNPKYASTGPVLAAIPGFRLLFTTGNQLSFHSRKLYTKDTDAKIRGLNIEATYPHPQGREGKDFVPIPDGKPIKISIEGKDESVILGDSLQKTRIISRKAGTRSLSMADLARYKEYVGKAQFLDCSEDEAYAQYDFSSCFKYPARGV